MYTNDGINYMDGFDPRAAAIASRKDQHHLTKRIFNRIDFFSSFPLRDLQSSQCIAIYWTTKNSPVLARESFQNTVYVFFMFYINNQKHTLQEDE